MRGWFISISLIIFVSGFAHAQKASPAKGNYLDFSDDTYYIAEDSPSLDVLLGDEWTIEMWLYVREFPPRPDRRRNVSVIFAKPGSYNIYLVSYLRDGIWDILLDGWFGGTGILFGDAGERIDPKAFKGPIVRRNQWQYLVVQRQGNGIFVFSDGKPRIIPDPRILPPRPNKPLIPDTDVRLYVGGTDPSDTAVTEELRMEVIWFGFQHMPEHAVNFLPFNGAIDEIRISDVARYPDGLAQPPQRKFRTDGHTLALWHFDERKGSLRYIDSSGRGNTLILSKLLSVFPAGKHLLTWGQIKQTL